MVDYRRILLTLVLVGSSLWCTALVAAAYSRDVTKESPAQAEPVPAVARPADNSTEPADDTDESFARRDAGQEPLAVGR